MWKLICKHYFPHLLTILVTWGKTKQPQKKTHTHTNDRRQVSVSKDKSLRQLIFSIGQYDCGDLSLFSIFSKMKMWR